MKLFIRTIVRKTSAHNQPNMWILWKITFWSSFVGSFGSSGTFGTSLADSSTLAGMLDVRFFFAGSGTSSLMSLALSELSDDPLDLFFSLESALEVLAGLVSEVLSRARLSSNSCKVNKSKSYVFEGP